MTCETYIEHRATPRGFYKHLDTLMAGPANAQILALWTSVAGSPWPRKHCPSSTTKGFLTTSYLRIMTLLSDRVGYSLRKIERK